MHRKSPYKRTHQYQTTASSSSFPCAVNSATVSLMRATNAFPYSGPSGGAGFVVSGRSHGTGLAPAAAARMSAMAWSS